MYQKSMISVCQKNFSSTLTRLADGFGSKKINPTYHMIRFTPKIGSPAQIDSALLIFYYFVIIYVVCNKHIILTYICQRIHVDIYGIFTCSFLIMPKFMKYIMSYILTHIYVNVNIIKVILMEIIYNL